MSTIGATAQANARLEGCERMITAAAVAVTDVNRNVVVDRIGPRLTESIPVRQSDVLRSPLSSSRSFTFQFLLFFSRHTHTRTHTHRSAATSKRANHLA